MSISRLSLMLCLGVFIVWPAGSAHGEPPTRQILLPDAQMGDFSAIADVELVELPQAWNYQIDAPEKPAPARSRDMSIDLPHSVGTICMGPSGADVFAAMQNSRTTYAGGGKSNLETHTWIVHRWQPSTGRAMTPITLYCENQDRMKAATQGVNNRRFAIYPGALMSIGPDGMLALVQTNTKGRLDLWSLKGQGKHLAALQACDESARMHDVPFWAAALDESHILTLTGNGHLVQWELPACKAVWQRSLGSAIGTESQAGLGVNLWPGLSPNQRHLAIWSGKALLLLDTATGKDLAIIECPNGGGLIEPTFAPDGTGLAVTEAEKFTQVLVIYDLRTGAERARIPLPAATFPKLGNSNTRRGGYTWLDSRYGLVAGITIVDLETGRPIWQFETRERKPFDPPPFASPGPRFWYGEPGRLTGITLPHAEALASAGKAPDAFIAGPGSTISVAVKLDAAPAAVEAVTAGFMERVREMGFKTAEGQRVTLRLTSQVHDTMNQGLVISLGLKGLSKEVINIQAIVLTTSYEVDGVSVWTQARDFLPIGGEEWHYDPSKSSNDQLREIQWDRIRQYASRDMFSRVPAYVMDPKAAGEFPKGPYPQVAAPARPGAPNRRSP